MLWSVVIQYSDITVPSREELSKCQMRSCQTSLKYWSDKWRRFAEPGLSKPSRFFWIIFLVSHEFFLNFSKVWMKPTYQNTAEEFMNSSFGRFDFNFSLFSNSRQSEWFRYRKESAKWCALFSLTPGDLDWLDWALIPLTFASTLQPSHSFVTSGALTNLTNKLIWRLKSIDTFRRFCHWIISMDQQEHQQQEEEQAGVVLVRICWWPLTKISVVDHD